MRTRKNTLLADEMLRRTRKIALLAVAVLMSTLCRAQETEVQYLSGTDINDAVEWEFLCSEGMRSGSWSTIPVPSCWELQGFGFYNYGWDENPHSEQGHYRLKFRVKKEWQEKRIFLKFDGVMTDATVSLNGQSAGPKHQGAFYPFEYEVTPLLRFDGENTLEVLVDKQSSNQSINVAERKADYWIFGGIFRPVRLEAQPQDFIQRVAIDARHTGQFSMQVFPSLKTRKNVAVEMRIETLEGKPLGRTFAASGISPDGAITLAGEVENPLTWNAEKPHLYQAIFRLKQGRKVLHEYRQKFGFRTIEFRHGDGFYVNGAKMKFKGVCRHTFWPESGRASSREIALSDIRLIREMNMNAVRMSHYPPDTYFLDYCDSVGLYVLDELAGWQNYYDTETAHRLVREMVTRDVNHPSIIAWDNGNENGFNTNVRPDYAILDPQHRHIIEPWSKLDGLDSKHYPGYQYAYDAVTKGDMVYMPTESLHGLQDGGHGAGLEDYWNLFLNSPLSAGQFLWNLADEGVVRRDLNDSIDVSKTNAPDGIVGPHHEKEGSFFTIRQIWCPVQVEEPRLDAGFDGTLKVVNRYDFINLKECSFSYHLLRYPHPLDPASTDSIGGEIPSADLLPQSEGRLHIPLPTGWQDYDVLGVSACDPRGENLFTWKWRIRGNEELAGRLKKEGTEMKAEEARKWMEKLQPRIVGSPLPVDEKISWDLMDNGVIRLEYEYTLDGEYDYAGIGFTYPEEGTTGATLLAEGPYRVWKNRLKGPTFGRYEKAYNNTITGQTWVYPEFKGYYADLCAVEVHNSTCRPLILVSETEGTYLQLFHPGKARHTSKTVNPPFPESDIGVMSVIPPIGSKFTPSEADGPQGHKEHFQGKKIRGVLYIK